MTYLNGVDVSAWQTGINLADLPGDFVICKATEGNSYISEDFIRQAEQTLSSGKLLGVYHYINGIGVEAEAQHFCNTIKPYLKKAIIILDWESGGNIAWGNNSYLDELVKRVKALTGITPMIYASASVFPFDIAIQNGCSTWIAQYANNDPTGYQANPWNENAYTCDMRQYSSSGRLDGWNGNLDINKFYGNRVKWERLAGKPIENKEEWEMATKQEVAKEVKETVLTAPKDSGITDMTLEKAIMWTNSDTKKMKTTLNNLNATVNKIDKELCEPFTSGLDGSKGDIQQRIKYIDKRVNDTLNKVNDIENKIDVIAQKLGVE